MPSRQEKIGVAVIVNVADGHPVTITARHPCDAGDLADILECSIALVAKQAITCVGLFRFRREFASLNGEDVDLAVIVVVKQSDAAAHGFGDLVERLKPAFQGEAKAGRLRLVDERGGRAW